MCVGGGGAQKVSYPRFSHFVAPFPVISDQCLLHVYSPGEFHHVVVVGVGGGVCWWWW